MSITSHLDAESGAGGDAPPSEELMFRQIVETAHDGIWAIDEEGRTRYANSQMAEMLGCTPDVMRGSSLLDFVFEEDRAAVFLARERRRAGLREVFDARYRRRDGTELWARVSTSALRDRRGQFMGAIAIFTDITSRKRLEDNLAFLAELQIHFAQLSSAADILETVGERLARHFGLSHCVFVEVDESKDEAVVFYDRHLDGTPNLVGSYRLPDFHTEDERQQLAKGKALAISDVRSGSRPASSAGGFEALGTRSLITAPYVRNGRWKFALSIQCADPRSWRDDEIELVRDIATRLYPRIERARAEEQLRESEARRRLALESAELGSWHMDLASWRLTTDERFRVIFGLDADEDLSYEEAIAVIHPDDRAMVREAVRRVAVSGNREPYSVEHRVVHPDGTIRWVYARGRTNAGGVQTGAGFASFDGTVSDITEKKRLSDERERLLEAERAARQEAETANRLKDEFLATLSHELRTPLTAIFGWSKLLREGKLDGPSREKAVESIERNAAHQTRLIEDLLDISRVITGKLVLDLRSVEMAEVVADVANTIYPAAQAKRIELETNFSRVHASITGDPNRLQQAVWNLLSNAVKFTPEGGRVGIQLRQVNSHIEIVVSDTGVGIEPEFLPYVFDRFRQADGRTTRQYGGLGLGLAIVRHLVELHGGTVEARSEGRGRGSTFLLRLPLLHGHSNRDVFPRSAAPLPQVPDTHVRKHGFEPMLGGIKILVVEDDADTRELIRTILSGCGADVVAIAGAVDAEREIERRWPDLIVSDIGMAGVDGYGLIRKVRDLEAARGDGYVPILAMALTAYAKEEDRALSLAAGYQAHLAKPIDPSELVAAVAGMIGRDRRGEQQAF